jgi:hypothetical protein
MHLTTEENPATETRYNLSIVKIMANVEHKNFIKKIPINGV